MFVILAVVILASAVLCVTTKRIMRAATFLLFVLFGIAGMYFLLDYTYLGAAQISVYAGGVTMIYIFAIQLVGRHTLRGMVERLKGSRIGFGALVALIGFLTTTVVLFKSHLVNNFLLAEDKEVPVKEIGHALVSADKFGYVLPFEFISIFLLACIIGGIMISRKE